MSDFNIDVFTTFKIDIEESLTFGSLMSCRTCKSNSNDLQHIFSYPDVKLDTPVKFADMLMECTSVQVLFDDGLPTVICQNCINQLINAYNFKKQCEKVDILFRNNLQQNQQTNDINADRDEHFSASPVSVPGFTDDFQDDEISDKNDNEEPLADHVVDQNKNNSSQSNNTESNCSLPIIENVQQGICINDLDLSNINLDQYDFQCKLCDQIFSSQIRVRFHMAIHLKRKVYTCKDCTITFVKEDTLDKHIKRGRCKGKPVVWCPICVKIFRTEELLQIHRIEKDRCKKDVKVCLNYLSQGDQYIFAIENKHKKKGRKKKKSVNRRGIDSDDEIPLADRILGKNKSNYVPVDVLESDDDDEDSSFEPEGISDEDDEKYSKAKKTWHCKKCDRILSIGTSKKIHTELCATKHICEICNESFDLKLSLRKHKRVVHNLRFVTQYGCSFCSKMFTKPKSRDHHEMLHKKRLRCKACHTYFENPDELKNHYKMNENCDKTHLCPVCGKKFRKREFLDGHMRRHRGEKPHKCQFCERAFTTSMELKAHMITHVGEKTHLCTYCGKGFARNHKLKTHIRIHTGELPYQCELCPRRFRQQSEFAVHRRVHTGERFFCDICEAPFLTNSKLNQHKRNKHGLAIPTPQHGIPILHPSDRQRVKPEIRYPVTVRYRAPNKIKNPELINDNPIYTYDPAAYHQ